MVREALRERFLKALKECGDSAGNGWLREILGWQGETYWHLRDAPIEEGAITAGRGRGGLVSLNSGLQGDPLEPKAAGATSNPHPQPAAIWQPARRKPKLTEHQQREARARVAAGETQRSIAPSYNVSKATISRLKPAPPEVQLHA